MTDLGGDLRIVEPATDTYVVAMRKARPIEESGGKYPPLSPSVSKQDGMIVERDVPFVLRDGVTIYTDIYRPDTPGTVPAIVAWSPYGKRAGYAGANFVAQFLPSGTVSEAAKDEGPDPAYWCAHGYAVVNPDARGAGSSEGDILFFGADDGRDCAEVIDWIGGLEWCNGNVGMSGNSWLAIAQYFAAAQRPERLGCIAPWEGMTDLYRQTCCPGGIPEVGFGSLVVEGFTGGGNAEDIVEMARQHPLFDAYWLSKIPVLENIDVPTYLTAGWCHFHLKGAFEAFERIGTDKKWMRAHREFEWPDYYAPENLEDLRRFFDRYLKGIRNGWELTPIVRLDVMDADANDHESRRPESAFPLAETEYTKLYLNAKDGCLQPELPVAQSAVQYDARAGDATFDFAFEEPTELTGYMKLRLWVEALGASDMDLFVTVQKLDASGEVIPLLVLGGAQPGTWPALLRVSHRELDDELSTEARPVLSHLRELPLATGEIVPVEIGIWPTSRIWHTGEQLRVHVAGWFMRRSGFMEPFAWELRNEGKHVVHTGGSYDSHLIIPTIPRPRPRPTLTGKPAHAAAGVK